MNHYQLHDKVNNHFQNPFVGKVVQITLNGNGSTSYIVEDYEHRRWHRDASDLTPYEEKK